MSIYQYSTTQFLPISREDAWHFFASPQNLDLITPPELEFRILTPLDKTDIYPGMNIDYTVKPLLGIPLSWKTEIGKVEHLEQFTDIQLKGPYKKWEHTHTFEKVEGGILMKDVVEYELPFGWIGDIVHALVVKRKIEQIFQYRKNSLTELFTTHGNHIH